MIPENKATKSLFHVYFVYYRNWEDPDRVLSCHKTLEGAEKKLFKERDEMIEDWYKEPIDGLETKVKEILSDNKISKQIKST